MTEVKRLIAIIVTEQITKRCMAKMPSLICGRMTNLTSSWLDRSALSQRERRTSRSRFIGIGFHVKAEDELAGDRAEFFTVATLESGGRILKQTQFV